ncbi:MAG: helix-turn-helix transcriptional regulator [Bacteroidetes bacterium]|nr:helix-turn-helix transcriptional regulator [Bacteroidota bacterium]
MLTNFIESLHAQTTSTMMKEVLMPISFNGQLERHNILIKNHRGKVTAGKNDMDVPEHSYFFFPAGQPFQLKLGSGNFHEMTNTNIVDAKLPAGYLRTVSAMEEQSNAGALISIVAFDVTLYEAIPFFEVLDIPPFPISESEELAFNIRHLVAENEMNRLGHDKIVNNYMEEILINVCRFINDNDSFKPFMDKLNFLADRRLVDIVKYIRENLDKDLSNKTIANVAYISEDYVGQFFKSLTGKNLQDYIESQRLERALLLLKTIPDNIQEIAARVGFKDPAYFSRRFKMKYGANANSIRHGKAQTQLA